MTTHLLWTGGWDSTYRLLDLLLVHRAPVKSYYVIDVERPGFAAEIRTMARIREAVFKQAPFARDLLGPTTILERSQLADDPGVTEAIKKLRAGGNLGLQYDWLIRFAKQYSPGPLELSIHKDDKAHAVLQQVVVREQTETGAVATVKPGSGELEVFSVFRFPLFDLTKLDMQRDADKAGFRQILEMTWFCHRPLPNGEPCGTCAPCNYTREEGLGRRIPRRGRMRERWSSLRRKLGFVSS